MRLKFIKDIFEPGFTHLTVGKVYTAYNMLDNSPGFYVICDDRSQHQFSPLGETTEDGFNSSDCWERV